MISINRNLVSSRTDSPVSKSGDSAAARPDAPGHVRYPYLSSTNNWELSFISVSPGFNRNELKSRYDVAAFDEDDWHAYSGQQTFAYVTRYLSNPSLSSSWLLNAGAGVYELRFMQWKEVSLDLFIAPVRFRQYPICASVERLPFRSNTFGAVACVGEVLGYCDPAAAIAEFGRVIVSSGVLICDFGSSRSIRNWFDKSYGRAADLITAEYNRTPEKTWVYDPSYVDSLLAASGFKIRDRLGTHTWSALAKRLGLSSSAALSLQRHLEWLRLPSAWAEVTTIVASKT